MLALHFNGANVEPRTNLVRTGRRHNQNPSTTLALPLGFRIGDSADPSANARKWIILELFEQAFASDFGLQDDPGTESVQTTDDRRSFPAGQCAPEIQRASRIFGR
jgi:hypothetical protein